MIQAAEADEGDYVEYHMTIYDSAGTVRYTTDPGVAAQEIAAGNHHLDSNLSSKVYGERGGVISLAQSGSGLNPSRYMFGTRVGDTVKTPIILDAFSPVATQTIPKNIAPVLPSVSLPASHIREAITDSDNMNPDTQANYTGSLEIGTSVLYEGVIPATIMAAQNDSITLALHAYSDDTTVYSKRLGFNFTVREQGDGSLSFSPQLQVGQLFSPIKCSLPFDLASGRYRVISETPDGYVVGLAPEAIDQFQGEPLSFEFTITKIMPWPDLLQLKAQVARLEFKAQQALGIPNDSSAADSQTNQESGG